MNQKNKTDKETLSLVSIRASVHVPLYQYKVNCEILTFHNLSEQAEHLLLGFGDWSRQQAPLVRVHSECLTGDVFGSALCDCGPQLKEAIDLLKREGGILLYMRQEGRGIGLYNKLDTYVLQSLGRDTYQANEELAFALDSRDYACAAQMLKAAGVQRIKLITNNPDKRQQLIRYGIEIVEKIPTGTFENQHNKSYLLAKRLKTQHTLEVHL